MAPTGTLSAEDSEELIRLIEDDPRVLLANQEKMRLMAGASGSDALPPPSSILNPAGIARMVESRPQVGACIFRGISYLEKRGFLALGAVLPLWQTLVEGAITMQSMDVVARLAVGMGGNGGGEGYLSPDLLAFYVDRCMNSCQDAEPSNVRQRRLVAVFLQALVNARCLTEEQVMQVNQWALATGSRDLYAMTQAQYQQAIGFAAGSSAGGASGSGAESSKLSPSHQLQQQQAAAMTMAATAASSTVAPSTLTA
jgi:CCR4-NOT transcription complex subunit 11